MASLFRESLRPLAAATLLAALLFTGSALLVMDRLYGEANALALGEAAEALAAFLPAELLEPTEGEAAEAERRRRAALWAERARAASKLRLTLVRPDGSVLADSRAEAARMDNHGDRPEILRALAGEAGSARRESATVGMELFYAARPLRGPGGEIRGALRVAVDLPSLRARLAPARGGLLLAVLLVAAAALGGAALFARRVARPLRTLAEAAAGLSAAGLAPPPRAPAGGARDEAAPAGGPAGGGTAGSEAALRRLRRAAAAPGPEEVRVLGRALSAMAAELLSRVAAAEAEGRERKAILDGMAEAVLALDPGLRVTWANREARRLFGLEAPSGAGSPASSGGPAEPGGLAPLPRLPLVAGLSSELEASAKAALAAGGPLETELSLFRDGGERIFRVYASPLGPGPGEEGLVVVLNDLSRLRSLERVRRDFVANVSHELRTPIQLVKGFAEALREGGLAEPEKAERFVSIIARQASRMESLIGDLLSLASLEQEGQARLPVEEEELGRLCGEAIAALEPKAEARGLALRLDCEPGLRARVNGGLIVQALVNLLDNAIRHSPEGGEVSLRAALEGGELLLEVRDRGRGIPAQDLPRIFERFYRVDKGRGRELGGTGLGLAIVRHIALAHGGSAEAESWEAEGSRFLLRLPRNGPPEPGSPGAPSGRDQEG